MFDRAGTKAGALALTMLVGAVGLLAFAAGGGAAAVPGCTSYGSQGAAQDEFLELGGSPARNPGNLDHDGDGVACEGLSGPYKGYATIGYNREKQFFYGVATMPPSGTGESGFPCMYGNRRFPDAPRRVDIYRVTPQGDKPLLGEFKGKAEARLERGQLLWKAPKGNPPFGRYYVSFEPRVPLNAYGANECPSFSSRPTLLPRPRR
jgi:hypothetical protein